MMACLPVSKAAKYLEILIIIWQCLTSWYEVLFLKCRVVFTLYFEVNFGVGQYLFFFLTVNSFTELPVDPIITPWASSGLSVVPHTRLLR